MVAESMLLVSIKLFLNSSLKQKPGKLTAKSSLSAVDVLGTLDRRCWTTAVFHSSLISSLESFFHLGSLAEKPSCCLVDVCAHEDWGHGDVRWRLRGQLAGDGLVAILGGGRHRGGIRACPPEDVIAGERERRL